MLNEEHLAILKQGVEVWNEWRKKNPEIRPEISGADLRYAALSGVNLSEVNLENAYLRGADLGSAILSGASINGAILDDAAFSDANLSRVSLKKASLASTNLSGANFSGANLSEASLLNTNFRGANLSEVNLEQSIIWSTDFNKAILTGSCIEDWHIIRNPNLDEVICDYVYLRSNNQERYPPSGNFVPGDFSKLFPKKLEIEIRELLEEFSQTYQTTTTPEKMAVVAEAAEQIEKNPTLKARVLSALKLGGTEAFKEAINHPLVNILIATIEGWQDAE